MSNGRKRGALKKFLKIPAHYLYVALGGSLGAITRIFLFALVPNQIVATLLCNIFGTFLLACVIQMERHIYPELKNSIVVGFCGGLSIFATFSKDSVLALKSNNFLLFFSNFFANFLLCIGAVYLAIEIANLIRAHRQKAKAAK